MSRAAHLIQQARAAGLELLLRDGRLILRGEKQAVDQWRTALSPHRAELVAHLAAECEPEPDPDPRHWKELAQAYHAHHFGCKTCIAAGQGYGGRCPVGTALWGNYSERTPA